MSWGEESEEWGSSEVNNGDWGGWGNHNENWKECDRIDKEVSFSLILSATDSPLTHPFERPMTVSF